MAAPHFTFIDDAEAFETLKKAGGEISTIDCLSNDKKTELCVAIEIGGIRFQAFKEVKTEAAEHLLTDDIAERKAS